MIPDNKETLERVVELLSASMAKPQSAGTNGDPFVIVPSQTKVESLAHLLPPTRIKRKVAMLEAGSFIEYVNRFKTANTLVFVTVTETSAQFACLLDYHAGAPELKAAFCDHRVDFATVQTPEWKTWMEANRKAMDQVAFATWLEDNATLFTQPTGAELLELVQTLEGSQSVRFNSAVRLQDGKNKLHYDEDVVLKGQASTKDGTVELPAVLVAGIAPFQGAPKYEVRARLKYRIEGRKLTLWFETIAVHVIVRDSIMLVVKQVADTTGIVPLIGTP